MICLLNKLTDMYLTNAPINVKPQGGGRGRLPTGN